MIRYAEGNLLEAPVEALVNTVNEVGVMGKGIALMFRDAFPENYADYERACRAGEVRVGRMLVTENRSLIGPRWIINFPTKKHWRQPSRLEWVQAGLEDLTREVRERGIRSLALPPLGCGNGGLRWSDVRREIEERLSSLDDVDVVVYRPTDRYQNSPKRKGAEELTPARALIAELVRRYSILGMECSLLEVQKLAWFLSRALRASTQGDPLDLKFVAGKYGPYADSLRHLLDTLDGSYLHSDRRISDARPLDPIRFDDSRRGGVDRYLRQECPREYLRALDATSERIDGFESPLGMELLATVDWLVTVCRCEPTLEAVKKGLADWPGAESARRKQKLFTDQLLCLAIDRLTGQEQAEPVTA